jgi:transcriptional regulator GlxA family with amidase domain
VVIAAFEGVQALDVVGPFEVFTGANAAVTATRTGATPPYDVQVLAAGTSVCTESGLPIGTTPWPTGSPPPPGGTGTGGTAVDITDVDTLIVPGGLGVHSATANAQLVGHVRDVGRRARRIATVCSGTFLAAEAGLLTGRTVTTHWARADQLARAHPSLTVDPDPIYVRDGDVWSSAGVTAGIDLCLALVDDDLGGDVAQTVARWLVMFLHRPGGQSQFALPVWAPRARHAAVRAVQERIERDPRADHRLETLAAVAAMSPRHLARVFTEEVGDTPGRYVEKVRVDAARALLERTDDTLDRVAAQCGFGTAETLRRTFHRHLAVAPDQYRRRFRTTVA